RTTSRRRRPAHPRTSTTTGSDPPTTKVTRSDRAPATTRTVTPPPPPATRRTKTAPMTMTTPARGTTGAATTTPTMGTTTGRKSPPATDHTSNEEETSRRVLPARDRAATPPSMCSLLPTNALYGPAGPQERPHRPSRYAARSGPTEPVPHPLRRTRRVLSH